MKKNRVLLLLLLVALAIPVSATTLSVNDKGDRLEIFCYPSEPIKAWEFNLHYEGMKIMDVFPGPFFEDFVTFFFANITECNVVAYCLTLGPGNMTTMPGIIATIPYVATGDIAYSFDDVGLTNDETYVTLDGPYSSIGWFSLKNASVWEDSAGYFSFNSSSFYNNTQQGYFTFRDVASWWTPKFGWLSFRNASSSQDLESGYFRFKAKVESQPIPDIIGDNFLLIVFIVIVCVVVIGLTFVGLQWQKRNRL